MIASSRTVTAISQKDARIYCEFEFTFHTGEITTQFTRLPQGSDVDAARTGMIPELEASKAEAEYQAVLNG